MTEEKHLKKEKKHKNGKASVKKRTCVDEGNLTDLDPELESCVRADEKAGKKKRKEKNDTECLVNAKSGEEMNKTKKKKKKKQVGDDKVEAPLTKIPEVNNNKETKKSKCTDIEHAEIEVEEEELPKKVKKKRKKPGEQKKEKKNNTADKNTSDDIDERPVPKKHKKSKLNLTKNQETPEETGDVEGVKKSKMAPTPEVINKTKEKKHGNTVSLAEINDVKKKKNKSKSGDINVEEEKRQKNKARKLSVECADVEETKLRKKKKSKQYEQQSEENVDTRTDRKNKKRKECTTTAEAPAEAPCSENGMKKKKKKKVKEEVDDQNEPSQVDVGFLSVKNGNAGEVTHNQERGQALQMGTDQASQPPQAANPSGLGQWSTAQFDSSEKQQKFLRLMGGFRKGFQPAGTTARAKMALGKDGQQQLQQKLVDEFDRAHSRRMDSSNRGAGIGFTAPANKKFSIDINALRSVRFDD